ncbi:MAG TPA: glucose 1-dehydrogenase [Acidimicrobiales bacterium]|nr:glucose 1-dehydrogenase [Acidimicrobiales bacterium]
MTARLNGMVAVITGGASGIGAETARRFVTEGAKVVLADVQEDAGEKVAADLGDDARFVRTDVTSEADIEAAVQTAVSTFGRLDVMFNNAGIIGAVGPIGTLRLDDYERTMAVTLRSVVLGMKHAAAVMVPQRSGVILSTSSVAAVAGGLGAHTYSAAKAAVIGLTQSVAAELWPCGIRVNAVVPGKISTPMTAALRGRAADALDDDTPEALVAERKGQARDIAAAAAFLASEDGRFVTGESLRVDGGLTRAGTPSAFASGAYQSAQMIAGPQEQR